jgi:hypothetical protein
VFHAYSRFVQSRLDQLRKIHDKMVFEIQKKEKAIADLQRRVADRDLIDMKNNQELKAGEVSLASLCVEFLGFSRCVPPCRPVECTSLSWIPGRHHEASATVGGD